ncbi:hypothetical protein [Gracilibacillus alcaliphilus]|uniref:hypothetical protein n=1 Tax=Gracilibacillus alcaliphilus TaxID=1401441 RepID=UPI00195AB9C7|nr:hypothetical protein [Gracilibacillus alcaliphilus]MBM7676784.1 hypothetical protein [Gracilibacillus alcaliphilus]
MLFISYGIVAFYIPQQELKQIMVFKVGGKGYVMERDDYYTYIGVRTTEIIYR